MLNFFHQFNLIFYKSFIVNNLILLIWIVVLLLFTASRSKKLLFNNWVLIFMPFYIFFETQFSSYLEMNKLKVRNILIFIFSIFNLILLTNILGLLPYVFSLTSHLIFTMFMSLLIWLISLYISFDKLGIDFFSTFIPMGCPMVLAPVLSFIETLSYLARILSLGLRLGVNIFAGHLLLSVIGSFGFKALLLPGLLSIAALFPILIMVFVFMIEFMMVIIQAIVFCLLSTMYISDSINLS